MYPLLLNGSTPWEFAVGHYLGVDHASHVYRVDSPEVAQKLRQTDQEISNFLEALLEQDLPERVLFLMFGDHGMLLNGMHGSGSPEEVESVLVALDLQQLKEGHSEGAPCLTDVPEMHQVDLAATLALLLDVPIPFGSIGKISRDLLELSGSAMDYSTAIKINAWQVAPC